MGLEDIVMMRAVPTLYGISTWKRMSKHTDGIYYMRTTRAKTPIIYRNEDPFVIGGCSVLRQSDNDVACIVAAGITVFEALDAYEQLQKEGISISVLDLYCVKPLDTETLKNWCKIEQSYYNGLRSL